MESWNILNKPETYREQKNIPDQYRIQNQIKKFISSNHFPPKTIFLIFHIQTGNTVH